MQNLETVKERILNALSETDLTNINSRTKKDLQLVVKALKKLASEFQSEIQDSQFN